MWQPVASSAGLGPVERGLFGQTSRACRGERKNEALGEARAGGPAPTRARLFPAGALGPAAARASGEG